MTIGHSVRPLAVFFGLLETHRVRTLADVRSLPRSRRHPHFDQDALARELEARGLRYAHLPALGGLRQPRPGSPHTALGAGPLQAYADHMGTPEFARGFEQLLALAARDRTCVMCAEADPARCHRSLLADLLVVRGTRVEHIVDDGPRRLHRLSRAARVVGDAIAYDIGQRRLGS